MTEPSRQVPGPAAPGHSDVVRRGLGFAGVVLALALVLLLASLLRNPAGPDTAGVLPNDSAPPQPSLLSAKPVAEPPTQDSAPRPASASLAREPPAVEDGPPQGPVGIHAFPPLGTRPQLSGVIVPDDFELPPGYARHFQSTDDGRRLPPILMFDPVNPPLDEWGEPIDIPTDRVVPADRVPAGMPVEILEPPERPGTEQHSLRSLFRPG